MEPFYQDAPKLPHPYESDAALRAILQSRLPAETFSSVEPDLRRFGARILSDVYAMGRDAEENPPRLVSYAPWGQRIDEIRMARGWGELHRVAAEEGLIAIAYERKLGAASRLHQFAKLYLFHPSSAFYSCPLAMTDGAARVLELLGSPAQKARAFRRLTSRDGAQFWTSGQWMTERTGGSDVSGTSTVARREGAAFALSGDKWFTSATSAQMALALGRVEGDAAGSKGLSLFYVEMRDEKTGALRNVQVRRLKDKLGTHALPTAELTLSGTPAEMVGDQGGGVRKIASLLNISRLHNSICAVASQARALALAKDYAGRRMAFGKLLREHPLHRETIAAMQAEHEAGLHLTFHMVSLLGKDEVGAATADDVAVLRALTPVTKLFTGKTAVRIASEALEAFGGAGYVEDTEIPQLYRDAQVFSIWEGTTNVLSLDVLRALAGKDGGLAPIARDARARIESARATADLASACDRALAAWTAIEAHAARMAGEGEERMQASARGFALSLARSFAAALMLEHAAWCARSGARAGAAADVAKRWALAEPLAPLIVADGPWREATSRIAGLA